MAVQVLAAFVLLYWIFLALDIVTGIYFRTPVLKAGPVPAITPRISIVFSARNEAPQVRSALESMLDQDYPDYEVIAVNDRSEDETPAILKSFSHPRLKVLEIRELPPDWLGKNNGLYEGYKISTGSWVLFTDADVHFERGALSAAARMINEKNTDHLVAFPKMVCHHWIEAVFSSAFVMAFFRAFRPWAAQNPKSKRFVGVGAFNMVRREMYEKAGTHRKIALDVIDDLHLGRLTKNAGARQLAVFGGDFVSVQWVQGWKGVFKSLEKNAFAGFDYNAVFAAFATAAGVAVDVFPLIGLFFPQTFLFCAGIAMCAAVSYFSCRRVNSWAWFAFFMHPFGSALVLVLLWRSVLKVLKDGGVTWRGTFYDLASLRAYSKN